MKATHWRCAEQKIAIPSSHTADGLYIGLMSGTSADGVDAALVEIISGKVTLLATAAKPYTKSLQNRLLDLNNRGVVTLAQLAQLDFEIATVFAETAVEVSQHCNSTKGGSASHHASAEHIMAIGSHGQTVFHQPTGPYPGTLQLGNASVIAQQTGIDTVTDFRSADIACGGQGAPLTPAFNEWAFKVRTPRVILNLGGIANVTFLGGVTTGFDTGPANTLLDAWAKKHRGEPYDRDGDWARTGVCDDRLLNRLLSDPYFAKAPPKSTGPDYFNPKWLQRIIDESALPYRPEDVQATLVDLTALSVARCIGEDFPAGVEILLCGGGSHNGYLVERLKAHCSNCIVSDTDSAAGIDVDQCESIAFAWLAYRYKAGLTGNLPAVTGAANATVLGALYRAPVLPRLEIRSGTL